MPLSSLSNLSLHCLNDCITEVPALSLVVEVQDLGVFDFAVSFAEDRAVLVDLWARRKLSPRAIVPPVNGNAIDDESPRRNFDFAETSKRVPVARTPFEDNDAFRYWRLRASMNVAIKHSFITFLSDWERRLLRAVAVSAFIGELLEVLVDQHFGPTLD
jgi:hypothetical protein